MRLLGFECSNLPAFKVECVTVAAITSLQFKLSNLNLKLNVSNGVIKRAKFSFAFLSIFWRLIIRVDPSRKVFDFVLILPKARTFKLSCRAL